MEFINLGVSWTSDKWKVTVGPRWLYGTGGQNKKSFEIYGPLDSLIIKLYLKEQLIGQGAQVNNWRVCLGDASDLGLPALHLRVKSASGTELN